MEITWEGIGIVALVLVVGSFFAGLIETVLEDRKREREQREREALQRMPLSNLLPLTEVLRIETRLPLNLVEIDAALLEDIQKNGILEPIEIRVREDGSRIVWDGLHRLAIAVKLELKSVPVFFRGM